MHQHHAGHQHQKRQNVQAGTVVEYVYQTAAKTFDGPIGGYITAAATPDDTSNSDNSKSNNDNDAAVVSPTTTSLSPTPTPTPTPVQVDDTDTDTTSSSSTPTTTSIITSSTSSKTSSTSSTLKKEVAQPTSSSTTSSFSSSSSSSSSSSVPSTSPTSSFIEATSSSARPTFTAESNSSSNGGGMSSGAKAGLAIGIILAVVLLLGLLLFCFRRKRKHANEDYVKTDDEKAAYVEGLKRSQSVASTRTTATAPRLSLRPITQFMPDMAARGKAMNGAVPAAALGAAGGATVGAAASRDHNDPENPFGNHAEVPRKSQGSSEKGADLPIQNNAAENPFGNNAEVLPQTHDLATRSMSDDNIPAPLRVRTPTPEASAVAGGAVAGAARGLAAAQNAERHNAPKPLNLTPKRSVSPAASSPAVSEFSQTSVPAAAMVNGPSPNNVHRIQLDFKPSMDDELSLRAGQLVRLLHEYDDGWVSTATLLSASVSTALNKVSLLALVFQLALLNLALLVLHQEWFVPPINVPNRRPVAEVRQTPTTKAEFLDLTILPAANSAQCPQVLTVEALSALAKSRPQGVNDEAILSVRSAAERTARRVQAA
ncbi:MAG: hypothetical protein ASARMPREDX12_001633 [Alectoria sarmentosa]|nr:MAG: hypothetical protein ASARMPREDX12_001633 [Alectoria sarmentosa]